MKIMLIEDDSDMQELLIDYLKNYDYTVDAYEKPLQALKQLRANDAYVLVVLDLMLPQMNGFDVCKKIREFSGVPIIISSARGNLGDKVLAFECGADDYLAKPYEPKELIMRIGAILRRGSIIKSKKKVGVFEIDEDRMHIIQDGHPLELTKIEYQIFLFLLNNAQKSLSRQAIAQNIGIEHKDRAIDMHISNLRNKIFDDSKTPKYIKSVWGIGYRFIG